MHEAFKDFATQDFPIDRFYPVVKVNSQSSSEAILRATSSDSDAFYFPTPIPATAPVYNPTPLNLKDNKLQQLKDAQRKNHFNVSGRKFKKSLTPPKASSHTAWIISTLIFRPKSTLFYLSRLIKNHRTFTIYCFQFPADQSILQLLVLEAKFFDLRHFLLLSEKKTIDIHLGTNCNVKVWLGG